MKGESLTDMMQGVVGPPSSPDDGEHPYHMTVDLNVLEHLGINLYSSIAAVLTEAVANSWDADAKNVEIRIDQNGAWIEIVDDGVGMTVNDMNEKYLRIGYCRRKEDREHGKLTAKSRPIMGRKGLGKLSLFSIAKSIEVQSVKDGQPPHGLHMSVDGIQESIDNNEPTYRPPPVPAAAINVTRGTQIILREIKRQRLGRGTTALRKRLARRFSVIGKRFDFKVSINGQPITTEDRGDLPITQFLWTFGDTALEPASIPRVQEQVKLSDSCDSLPENCRVKGWIGTAHLPKELDSKDAGNLNGIVVFARGRLFHENILDKVNDGRLYTKYLTGQIEADFLDDDNKPDIATSDRQRVQEDDSRYVALLDFLRSSLSKVEKQWTRWRRYHEVKRAKETTPALTKWIENLPTGHRQSAEKLIAKLSALTVEDDDRKTLYRHGIFAFERMRIRGSTEKLASQVDDVGKLLKILADRDGLEASLYRDIVRSRLDVIRKFQDITDDNAKEKVLQSYLFEHLWLLDASWERATNSELMESRLTQKGVLNADLTEKEKLSRVDIAYRTYAGKHVIVELKRVGRKLKLEELVQQGGIYVDKLEKILIDQGDRSPSIEVVFVLGHPVEEEQRKPDRVRRFMEGISPGSRIVHYDSLIKGAHAAYSEYLEKSRELDRIEEIVDQI